MLAGVGQVMTGICWKMTLSEPVTLLEKFGLAAVATIWPVTTGPEPYVGTLTVSVKESLALAAMLVVRMQVRVASLQVQPPVESVSAVAVRPVGNARVTTTEL